MLRYRCDVESIDFDLHIDLRVGGSAKASA